MDRDLGPGSRVRVHVLIDGIKARIGDESARTLLVDQAFHAAALLALAGSFHTFAPGLASFWVFWLGAPYLQGLALVAGYVLSVHAVGVLVGRIVKSYMAQVSSAGQSPAVGLAGAGRLIRQLERSLVFLFLLMGHPGGIGFLVAAKSIFRIAELKDPGERMQAEYIILGTLMSFTFGIAVAYGMMKCLSLV